MASEEKIRARIREIADRPKNVVISDIEWVMNQLKQYGEVQLTSNVHMRLWRFDGIPFSVCTHRGGEKQLKAVYVKAFLDAMIEAGWL